MSKKRLVNIYMEPELWDRLAEAAEKHNVSTSEYIRTILKESLSPVDTKKKMDEFVKKIIESKSFKKALKEGQDAKV